MLILKITSSLYLLIIKQGEYELEIGTNKALTSKKANKLLHADSIQLSRFLLKTKSGKNSTNLLAGDQGVRQ